MKTQIRKTAVRASLCMAWCVGQILAATGDGDSGKIVTFDVPGVGTAAGQGTYAYANNLQGEITGYWVDSNGVGHGFVRHVNGNIVSFDAPGAGPMTQGEAINIEGYIVGGYVDSNNVGHGFLRAPDGTITSFDAPGADCSPISGPTRLALTHRV